MIHIGDFILAMMSYYTTQKHKKPEEKFNIEFFSFLVSYFLSFLCQISFPTSCCIKKMYSLKSDLFESCENFSCEE